MDDVTAPDWRAPRPLGSRGPSVTGLGLGTAPIGNMFAGVSDEDALATVDAAWDGGIRYFDTAPLYGHGASERRLGHALSSRPRDEYVLATKVGRVLDPAGTDRPETIFRDVGDLDPHFDYSRDAVLRSLEESLIRLRADRVDVVLVHDPDLHEDDALTHAFPTPGCGSWEDRASGFGPGSPAGTTWCSTAGSRGNGRSQSHRPSMSRRMRASPTRAFVRRRSRS